MSIQIRGKCITVKVSHEGRTVKGLTRSFSTLAEAKKYDQEQKARQKLGLLVPHPVGGVTKAFVTSDGRTFVQPLMVTQEVAAAELRMTPSERGQRSKAALDAYKKMQDERRASADVAPATAGGPTLGSIVRRFKKEITPKRRGHVQEDCRLGVFLRLALCKRPIVSLTTGDFESWQTHRIKQGVSGSTINRELQLWKRLLSLARDKWKVSMPRGEDGNSFNPAKIDLLPENEARDRRLPPDEEACLIRHAEADPWLNRKHRANEATRVNWIAIPLKLCLQINFRRGELFNMKRGDIDWRKREVVLYGTKNGSTRRVPLTSRSLAILHEAVATIRDDGTDRVFPICPIIFSRQFIEVRNAAATEMSSIAGFRFHDTRHESISRMSLKITNTVVLSKATDHRDVNSLKRYVNPTSRELADMME